MWRNLSLGITATIISLVFGGGVAVALAVPSTPPLDRPIVDQTGTLSSSQVDDIVASINTSRTKKDYQLAVLVIPTLGNDEYLEGYSLKVARQWGVGTAEKDNGVLLLVVMNDRKARIEIGRGLEGDLTDTEASRIIRNVLAPEFRNGNYAVGIKKSVQSIQAQVEGVPDPNHAEPGSSSSGMSDIVPILLFFGFWIFSWLGSILARSRSWWAGGIIGAGFGVGLALLMGWVVWSVIGAVVLTIIGFLLDFIVSKNYRSHVSQGESPSWWAGGSYWGSGGGGFGGGGGGSFGGGGFSGGGSSGSW